MPAFDLAHLPGGDTYRILASVVVPRPIAWVTSRNENGTVNIAPFSFFNLLGSSPPVVAIGVAPTKSSGETKDTRRNLFTPGVGFVVHLVDEAHAEAMNATAAELPSEESEAGIAGLTFTESVRVAPVPRIATAPAALECRVAEVVVIGKNHIILGEVVYIHLQDALWDAEKRHVRTEDAHFIGRMHGGGWYTRTDDLFHIERPR